MRLLLRTTPQIANEYTLALISTALELYTFSQLSWRLSPSFPLLLRWAAFPDLVVTSSNLARKALSKRACDRNNGSLAPQTCGKSLPTILSSPLSTRPLNLGSISKTFPHTASWLTDQTFTSIATDQTLRNCSISELPSSTSLTSSCSL